MTRRDLHKRFFDDLGVYLRFENTWRINEYDSVKPDLSLLKQRNEALNAATETFKRLMGIYHQTPKNKGKK